MSSHSGEGILVSKTKISNNKLIISLLTIDSKIVSGVFSRAKSAVTDPLLLMPFQFEFTQVPGKDLGVIKELIACDGFRDVLQDQYGQYFFLAEFVQIHFRQQGGEGFYRLLKDCSVYFRGNYDPFYHLYFIRDFIQISGHAPDDSTAGEFFDFRNGVYSNQIPSHSEYCKSAEIRPFFDFSNEKQIRVSYVNSSSRFAVLNLVIRFFEVQTGQKYHLRSLAVMRELR